MKQQLLCECPAHQDRCHRYLVDRMFEDPGTMAFVLLRQLVGFIRLFKKKCGSKSPLTNHDKDDYLRLWVIDEHICERHATRLPNFPRYGKCFQDR